MMVISGCAGMRTGKQYERLQSQVQLLEERVNQLERSSARLPSTDLSTPEEAFIAPAAGSEPRTSASKPAATSKSSSIKPSTREIQQALKNAGFYQGSVDGKMGSMTKEAVREFQRVNGLKADGVVGKQTWAKLSAYTDLSAAEGEVGAAETLK
jgi:peptidoglycan hydrolase-like protein with peptidoglycan-binding domain